MTLNNCFNKSGRENPPWVLGLVFVGVDYGEVLGEVNLGLFLWCSFLSEVVAGGS